MARGRRARPEAEDGEDRQEVVLEVEAMEGDDAITVVILVAIQAEAPGPRRSALEALHTALSEVKHRARSVHEHLGADFRDLLDRIEAL